MAKKGNAKKNTKSKNGKKSGPDAVAMKVAAPKAENPFETIWSRRKFDILGKKRKGEERRMGLARSRAIEKRENTLLKEYKQSSKASVFVDKRIGEHNDDLGEFDKAIMRSQREHQLKVGKQSKYNLSDGEEDDLGPVLGAISGRDDFDGILSDDDLADGEPETFGSKSVLKHINANKLHGAPKHGFEGDEYRHKSKKEVMQEIIMKSKLGKMEKAKQKEENVKLMDELDKSFASLVESQALTSLTEPGKMKALKALVKGTPTESVKKNEVLATKTKEQPDSYDKLVYEMAMDIRARPSERTKTPEEIAQEERDHLEKLEDERKKRMQATDDLSDEDDEKAEESAKKRKALSGDDLGDSFSVNEESSAKKGWVDEILERRDDGNSDSEEDELSSQESQSEEDASDDEESEGGADEQGKSLSVDDWEQSDEDDLGTDLDDDAEEENSDDGNAEVNEKLEPRAIKKSKHVGIGERKHGGESLGKRETKEMKDKPIIQHDIPFLIDAPKNIEELNALVENCSNSDVIVIVNRIRATNAIKLAAENRKKMQVFYGVLLQYFSVLASKKPLNVELLDMLVKPLIEMSMEIPYFAAICARHRLLRTRTQFCEALKNPEKGCWPSLKTIFLLRLWSMIFPCSDFRHAVMTPSILLMCEYLMRCPVVSGRDIAVGSFLCSMVLSVAKQSQKFCPEAILFLRTMLMAATDQKSVSSQESELHHLLELQSMRPLLRKRDHVKDISPLNFLALIDMPEDSSIFGSDDFRASVLLTVIETLKGFVEIHERLSSFPEIFLPIATTLNEITQQERLPEALKEKFKDVALLIKKTTEKHHMNREPLQMRKHKPVPIKMLNPKFEENFVKGRDYDPDRERAERRKMKKLIKEEAKGAARELRKDNHFLYEVKEKERAQEKQERAEKYGKALAFLQEQEHAFKSGQLGKGKGQKRKR